MVRSVTAALCGALSLATTVVAHGHVSGFIIDGVWYRGYESDSDPYDANPPITAGWTTDDKDNGL
jgi:lytic cellulose monooxygenase (C1-hydroxylating)